MADSLEVRWFFDEAPAAANTVFAAIAPGSAPQFQQRTDWYAYPCPSRTGIKFREGRLEAKLLLGERGEIAAPPLFARIEHWRKYSGPIDEPRPDDESLTGSGWIPVRKQRFTATYAKVGNVIQQVDSDDRVKIGCQVEWSEVDREQRREWTISLETLDAGARQAELIKSICRPLSAVLRSGGTASSYPAWLTVASATSDRGSTEPASKT